MKSNTSVKIELVRKNIDSLQNDIGFEQEKLYHLYVQAKKEELIAEGKDLNDYSISCDKYGLFVVSNLNQYFPEQRVDLINRMRDHIENGTQIVIDKHELEMCMNSMIELNSILLNKQL